MQRYEILLGKPVCKSFSNQYSDWVWALDTIFDILGLDPAETIDDWIPETIDFSSFLKYIARIGIGNYPEQLYEFTVKKDYDHYGELWTRIELNLYSSIRYVRLENFDSFSRSILQKMEEEIKGHPGRKLLEELKDAYKHRDSRFGDTQSNSRDI